MTMRGRPESSRPSEQDALAWKRVNALFEKHHYALPPARMRDELVFWLLAYDEQQARERERRRRGRLRPVIGGLR